MKWFKSFWSKIIFEVVVTLGLIFLFYFAKKYLPRRWRIQEETLKRYMLFLTTIMTNVASDEDTISEVLGKSKNIVDFFYEQSKRDKSHIQLFNEFVKEHLEENIEVVNNRFFMDSVLPAVMEFATANVQVMELDLMNSISKLSFVHPKLGDIDIYYVSSLTSGGEGSSSVSSYNVFASRKGFPYNSLLELLFNKYNNRILLTYKNETLRVEELSHQIDPDYKRPGKLFTDLVEEIDLCKKLGHQRSYILNGPPGTGKSTFCVELSQQISGKILKIDSGVINWLAAEEFKGIVTALKVDFLIIDDIDRISVSDMPTVLYLLESLKTFETKPTFLATVNNIEKLDQAVIRPGRFDDIIEFNLPDKRARGAFIRGQLKRQGIELVQADLDKFVKATEGMSHAYIKEFCIQYTIKRDMTRLVSKIKSRSEYLGKMHQDIDESEIADAGLSVSLSESDEYY